MAEQRSEPAEWASWQHRLGHLLWQVAAQTSVLGDAEFAQSSLSIPLTGLLDQIEDTPGITVTDISRRLPTTQQSVSEAAKRLEKLGYIERRLGSGRGVGLHLTAAGVEAHQYARQLEETFEQRLRDWIGDDDYTQLRTLLGRARDELAAPLEALRSAKSKLSTTPKN